MLSCKAEDCFGFQNFKKIAKANRDTSADKISGSSGPIKFEVTYCVIAKENPETRIAGKTSSARLKPAIMITMNKGIKAERKGNWRPTIFEISIAAIPVGPSIAMIGIPIAPNATGAVLAIKHIPAA